MTWTWDLAIIMARNISKLFNTTRHFSSRLVVFWAVILLLLLPNTTTSHAITYSQFSRDVKAVRLMYITIAKNFFWEFDSIILQNLSHILPLFCTPTWRSHHVSENQEYQPWQYKYYYSTEIKRPARLCFNPLAAEWVLRALIDFTLSNARRFYSSMGNPLAVKGLRMRQHMNAAYFRVAIISFVCNNLFVRNLPFKGAISAGGHAQ